MSNHPSYTFSKSEGHAKNDEGSDTSTMMRLGSLFQYPLPAGLTSFPPFDLLCFAEALASPVKYAIFEVLGYEFIRALEPLGVVSLSRVSGSLGSSARIGALGGGVLTMVHLALSLRDCRPFEDDTSASTLRALSTSLLKALWKETVFSLVAALMGTFMSGISEYNRVYYAAVAGLLGPVLALVVMFGVLGLVIGVVWSGERVKAFVARYRY